MIKKSALSLLLSLLVFNAAAQSPLGTVTGLAVDPNQAPIPAVKIALTSRDTGVKREAESNAAGVYSFPNLPPGNYKLAAEAKGFRPLQTPVFPLAAFRTVRQDLKFELAAATAPTSTRCLVINGPTRC